MNFPFWRVDDRLIHGQVVIGWADYLKLKRIILCDDSISESEWEKELYLSVVPENIEAMVVSADELANIIASKTDLNQTIIVLNAPAVLEKLQELGVPLNQVNVGGIHFKEGRKQYLSYLYLKEDEVDSFRRLIDSGISLVCQDVPGAKEVSLESLLNEG